VENYFHALRIRNKACSASSSCACSKRAQRRAPAEPDRSATQLAAEEMDRLVTEWFAEVLQSPPTKADQMLSTRGRLALLLADMPGKWQEQFLRPGPWPEEFTSAMRETFLRAGPDFQLSKMTPRPLDLGPITTLTNLGRQMPYFRMVVAWTLFALLLVAVFWLTHGGFDQVKSQLTLMFSGFQPRIAEMDDAPLPFCPCVPRLHAAGGCSCFYSSALLLTGWSRCSSPICSGAPAGPRRAPSCWSLVHHFVFVHRHRLHARRVWIFSADVRHAPPHHRAEKLPRPEH
jgi:hypothetical protein